MALCVNPTCGCAFKSSSLTITQTGGVVTLEMAGSSEITQIQADLADVIADLAAYITSNDTALGALTTRVSALESAVPSAVTTWASPINGGLTLGNGSLACNYYTIGKYVFASFRMSFGSTSAVTGDVSLNLPVAAAVSYRQTGHGWFYDFSAPGSSCPAFVLSTSASTVLVRAIVTSGTYTTSAVLSASIPFTWATNDIMSINVSYLAA